jgi:hypothetical protein
MAVKSKILLLIAVASASAVAAQGQTGFGDFINQLGGSTEFKTLQGSRLSAIGRVASAAGSSGNASITPDRARDDARLNFGYDFFLSRMSGYRFFNVDNKADQLAAAKAAKAKFAAECTAQNGSVEPDDTPVAKRFWQENAESWQHSDEYFTNTVVSGVCIATDQLPLGGFVAITRTLRTSVFFVRTNRTAIYAIKGDRIASAQTFADEEQERTRQQLLAEDRARQARLAFDAEQRRLAPWRKSIAVGTSTNCGLVIDVRGPLVQVQLPGNTTGPSGQREFWIKRTELTDHLPVYQCTFGN